ncbi:MAG: hypothetical protein FWG30_11950, partial [Eubacteriaceae bacterium]|nr:hypothetical protein [Eubacteriaceae bacterium]
SSAPTAPPSMSWEASQSALTDCITWLSALSSRLSSETPQQGRYGLPATMGCTICNSKEH